MLSEEQANTHGTKHNEQTSIVTKYGEESETIKKIEEKFRN